MNAAVPPTPEPAARRSLRARLAGGPFARRLALLDVRLYRLVRSRGRMPALRAAVRRFSRTGEHAAIWLAIGGAGAALDRPRRARWLRAAAAVLVTYLFNTLIKNVVRRKRPLLEDLPQLIATPTQLSFPSAHASSSFAAVSAYRGLLPGRPLLAVAAVMGWSRVYLGVHYPSDIAAGALLGTLIGRLGRR
ncbi:MAG TPA: phosphatase PAP2 family protein [Capillimicrobium sp.]|nr:phosphatase PAP2 family protein [Capillimicrobium sp.]